MITRLVSDSIGSLGQHNAMFIIRIESDFSTVTHASYLLVLVVLLNRGLALSFRDDLIVTKRNQLILDLLRSGGQIDMPEGRHLFDCFNGIFLVSLLLLNVFAT